MPPRRPGSVPTAMPHVASPRAHGATAHVAMKTDEILRRKAPGAFVSATTVGPVAAASARPRDVREAFCVREPWLLDNPPHVDGVSPAASSARDRQRSHSLLTISRGRHGKTDVPEPATDAGVKAAVVREGKPPTVRLTGPENPGPALILTV